MASWRTRSLLVPTLAATLAFPLTSQAVNVYWHAGPFTWDTTSQTWLNSAFQPTAWPSTNDQNLTAVFTGVITKGVSASPGNITINGNISVNSMLIAAGGYGFLPGTGTLTLVGSSPNMTIDDDVTVAVPIQGAAGVSFTFGADSPDSVALSLTAPSTYSGPTSIFGGGLANRVVSIGVNNALPDGNINISAATLQLNSFSESFANGAVSGNVAITANGTSISFASLDNDGSLSLAGLSLIASSINANGFISANATSITTANLSGSGNIALSGSDLTAAIPASTISTFSGTLSGQGVFFKTGAGELALSGNNSLTSLLPSLPALFVQEGTLTGDSSSLSAPIEVDAGATLLFVQPANGTFTGSISGDGLVQLIAGSPASPVRISFANANTFYGNLQVGSNVTLAASNDNQLGTFQLSGNVYAAFTFDGGTLQTTAPLTSARNYTITSNGGTLDTAGNASTFTGSLTSTGNGTLSIIGGGTTSFSSNSLSLFALSQTSASSSFSNATIALASTATALSLSNANLSLSSSNLLTTGSVKITGNSSLSGSSFDAQSGPVFIGDPSLAAPALTLGFANWSITGNLTLNGHGTLSVPSLSSLSATDTTSLAGNSSITVNGGLFSTGALSGVPGTTLAIADGALALQHLSALTIGSNTASSATFAGNITNSSLGAGSLHKVGANTQILSGANAYSGNTTIDAGTLIVASNTALPAASLITNNANLTISAPSVTANAISGSGNLTLSTGARLTLAGSSASKQGFVDFNSNAILDIGPNPFILEATGLNKLFLLTRANADVQSFPLTNSGITSSTVTTDPTHFAIAVIDNAVAGFSNFGGQPVDSNSLLIAPELLGDADLSGMVDLSDLSIVLNNFGATNPNWTNGNFDRQPTIDLTDLSDVLNNFGATNPNASISPLPTPTPEPASALLILAALPAVNIRRRCHEPRSFR